MLRGGAGEGTGGVEVGAGVRREKGGDEVEDVLDSEEANSCPRQRRAVDGSSWSFDVDRVHRKRVLGSRTFMYCRGAHCAVCWPTVGVGCGVAAGVGDRAGLVGSAGALPLQPRRAEEGSGRRRADGSPDHMVVVGAVVFTGVSASGAAWSCELCVPGA